MKAKSKAAIVVVGNGMVGHKFIELMVERGATETCEIITFCEESRLAYDRVNLSSYFAGNSAETLSLVQPNYYAENGIHVYMEDRVVSIDRATKTLTSAKGLQIEYDQLVLATGSYPFVPPIKGNDALGTFVYRTLDDLDALQAYATQAKTGVVVGGGLLGLECANALKNLGLTTHVVEFAPRLMPMQLDTMGGVVLREKIEALGVAVHTDLIVFSAGIRLRNELAHQCGLTIGERGGIVIDDCCRTSDPAIFAIGECAVYENPVFGLVAPGYQMAGVLADQLCVAENAKRFTGADMSTKLKLLGIEVASFGDAFATTPASKEVSLFDNLQGTYKKIVIDASGKLLLGGILVGDASSYGMLYQMMANKLVLPPHPEDLILPPNRREGGQKLLGIAALPATAKICTCENLSKQALCKAIADYQVTTIPQLKTCTKAGTGCGGCVPMLTDILKAEMHRAGLKISYHICEHFPYSRQELYHLVQVYQIKTFEELLGQYGQGLGCEICKPAVASILASTNNDYILKNEHLPLQDSNDHFLANIQRDGTYSVVPRIPGGEITPDKLIAIGQVAKEFDLYVKITGGQRIDLFGARVDQLPHIWAKLINAGFESGHAYGKALRTVKSCVGSTWCRYGQQDSVAFAIQLEERYKGLRAPHKIKAAVSGCTRECAEAQSKDFGLITTEKAITSMWAAMAASNPNMPCCWRKIWMRRQLFNT